MRETQQRASLVSLAHGLMNTTTVIPCRRALKRESGIDVKITPVVALRLKVSKVHLFVRKSILL